MNSYLLNRALGSVNPNNFHVAQTTRLVHHLEAAPGIRFSSRRPAASTDQTEDDIAPLDQELSSSAAELFAHKSGVNCLAVDQFEGRYMISGGADPSIHLWDLETRGSELEHAHRSCASVSKSSAADAHTHAITSLSIYPFDPVPSTIFSTSHDGTLKLSALDSPSITPVHTFSLDCTPYSHSFSSQPGSTLLVAVGTSERSVRLVDLRSGLSTQGLPGHNGAVLSVAWAPHRPHLLASGSVDNRVIIFDVRRGGHNSAIATLDMDDPVGLGLPGTGSIPASYESRPAFSRHARAHNGPVTGVRWTSNGSHIVTTGQDSRIRVWDSATGANTLVHFGPRVRNSSSSHLAERAPLVIPKGAMSPGHETLLWPNFNEQDDRGEIFMFELREGTFVKRLRVPGLAIGSQNMRGRSSALSAARVNDLVWRGNGASGEGIELFSAHGDGTIRTWVSREPDGEPTEAEEADMADRKRKRDVLDEVYQGFLAPDQPIFHM